MPAHRGRQKALEKKKKRRLSASTENSNHRPSSPSGVAKLAASCPFGPAFMSPSWRSEDEATPELVSVILTKKLPDGEYVAVSCLVDRTCLGVKNAFFSPPLSESELKAYLARYSEAHDEPMEEVSVLEAQSVVFHALDYARSLGFSPPRDFKIDLVGPRPETLLDTPLAKPSRARYVPGPDDDVARILRMLERHRTSEGPEDADARIKEATTIWLAEFHRRFPEILEDAHDEYFEAVLGHPFDPDDDAKAVREHASSLPLHWAAFFRPMDDGRTGVELARSFSLLRSASMAGAIDRIARARVIFGDVLSVDRPRSLAHVRDVFDGRLVSLRIEPKMAKRLTRWTRLFGLAVELDDGTYCHPSVMMGHVWLRNVSPEDFVERLNTMLEELGYDEVIDRREAHSKIVRWVGVAHGVLMRMMGPSPEEAAEMAKNAYIVNSDGDRFEAHEAKVLLDPDVETAMIDALRASDDFLPEDSGFEMVGAPQGTNVFETESLASIQPERPGEWRISANSTKRYERVLARLSAAVDRPIRVADLKVLRPWEARPGVASEESADTRRLVVASQRLEIPNKRGAAKKAARELLIDAPLRALDEDIPMLGGRPRDLAKTPDGRARVESWLREWELRGLPEQAGWAFLDLDAVRQELELPTIADASV